MYRCNGVPFANERSSSSEGQRRRIRALSFPSSPRGSIVGGERRAGGGAAAERGDRLRRAFPSERDRDTRPSSIIALSYVAIAHRGHRGPIGRFRRQTVKYGRLTSANIFVGRGKQHCRREHCRRHAACAAYRFASRRPTRAVGSAFAPTGVPPARIISPIITSEMLPKLGETFPNHSPPIL